VILDVFSNNLNDNSTLRSRISVDDYELTYEERYWSNSSYFEWKNIEWSQGDPISASGFKNSYFKGGACSWNRIISALNHGKKINIAVIGGSMTTGMDCGPIGEDGTFLACAWTTFLSEWFVRKHPEWKISVRNFATGGFNAANWVQWPEISLYYDVYIVDLTVNSVAYSPGDVTSDMSNLLIRLLSTRGESTGRSPGIF